MGQLEKYGLYVLCLVICLILGVAIWGGDPGSATINQNELGRAAADANAKQKVPPVDAGNFLEPVKGETRNDPPRPLDGLADMKPVGADPGKGTTPAIETPPTALRTYKVKKDETLEEIAKRELGDRSRVPELLKLNPEIKNPARDLQPNMVLQLPPRTPPGGDAKEKDKDASKKPEAKPGTWIVRSGDSPHRIAEHVLGKGAKGNDIVAFAEALMRINQITDETKLKLGTELKLPAPKK